MIILESMIKQNLRPKLVLSKDGLGSKRRKEREQKVREKIERNKEETREKQDLRPFQGTFLLLWPF